MRRIQFKKKKKKVRECVSPGASRSLTAARGHLQRDVEENVEVRLPRADFPVNFHDRLNWVVDIQVSLFKFKYYLICPRCANNPPHSPFVAANYH